MYLPPWTVGTLALAIGMLILSFGVQRGLARHNRAERHVATLKRGACGRFSPKPASDLTAAPCGRTTEVRLPPPAAQANACVMTRVGFFSARSIR